MVRRLSLVMHVVSILQLSAVCARAMAVAGAVLPSSTAAAATAGVAAATTTGHGGNTTAAGAAAVGPGLSSSSTAGKSSSSSFETTKRAQRASAFVSSGKDERTVRSGRAAAARFRAVGWLHLLRFLLASLSRLVPGRIQHLFCFCWSLWHSLPCVVGRGSRKSPKKSRKSGR